MATHDAACSVRSATLRICAYVANVLLLLLAAGLTPALAQSSVTLRVDMGHTAIRPGDNVIVRGSDALLGFWEGHAVPMQREAQSDTFSADLTLPADRVGSLILYKYVILRAAGEEEWETTANRSLLVPPHDTVLMPVVFGDRIDSGIGSAVHVTFELDLQDLQLDGHAPEAVALTGGRAPLTWELAGSSHYLAVAGGVWTADVTFPAGTSPDVPFKFGYLAADRWIWESLPGHINHVFLLDDTGPAQVVQLRYDNDAGRIVPASDAPGLVDNYEAVVSRLGERGAREDYGYAAAISHLMKGRTSEARTLYDTWRGHHPGRIEIDDFEYLWIENLAVAGQLQAALVHAEKMAQQDPDPERRAHFDYLKGEVLLNAGRRDEARRELEDVLRRHVDQPQLVEYARVAMAASFMQEEDSLLRLEAAPHLEALAASASTSEARQHALESLADVYVDAGNVDAARSALRRLEEHSTARGRWRVQQRVWNLMEARELFDDVLLEMEAVSRALPASLAHELLQMRGRMQDSADRARVLRDERERSVPSENRSLID